MTRQSFFTRNLGTRDFTRGQSELAQVRLSFFYSASILLIFLYGAIVVINLTTPTIDMLEVVVSSSIVLVLIVGLSLSRLNQVNMAFGALILGTFLSAFFNVGLGRLESQIFLLLLTTAFLGSRLIFVIGIGIGIGRIGFEALQLISGMGQDISVDPIVALVLPPLIGAGVGIAIRLFVELFEQALDRTLATGDLLNATAEIAQLSVSTLDADRLLPMVVDRIRDRFGHYHVQVFLFDETATQAVVVASTGEIGQQLLARNHQITVGSRSVVGQATLRGTPYIVNDADRDETYFRNELLPNTNAEMALPLRDGTTVIGALDLQSTRVNAFTADEVQTLQITADLIGTAVGNARRFAAQRQAQRDGERLRQQLDATQREIERLNRELTRDRWQTYSQTQRERGGVMLQQDDTLAIVPRDDWSPAALNAITQGTSGQAQSDGNQVTVPLVLRGEVIGAIEVETDRYTGDAATEIVQQIADRLAISLESARLYEETQQIAAQEQRLSELSARFQEAVSVDDLLQTALNEITDLLGAQQGAIRLGGREMTNGAAPAAQGEGSVRP